MCLGGGGKGSGGGCGGGCGSSSSGCGSGDSGSGGRIAGVLSTASEERREESEDVPFSRLRIRSLVRVRSSSWR